MAAGVEFVMQLRYYDADGNAKVLEGEDANRVISFSNSYVGTVDNASRPPRLVIAPRVPLEDRVAAIEAQLAAATSAATPGTLVKRDTNGDIFTANFRGNIKEASAGVFVKIFASDGTEVVRFGKNGGFVGVRFFDGGPVGVKGALNSGDPTATLAVDCANTFDAFGLTATS
jgi:hypothetical protein